MDLDDWASTGLDLALPCSFEASFRSQLAKTVGSKASLPGSLRFDNRLIVFSSSR